MDDIMGLIELPICEFGETIKDKKIVDRLTN